MQKVRIGVVGAGRGQTMMDYCTHSENAQLVAVCDNDVYFLQQVKNKLNDQEISYYESFDEFLKHDMDAVILANYATEHAPFAIRCLKAGLHVMSEVLPCQTLKEAVELVEAVENSGKIYAYAENYCYMGATREMKRLYQEGALGEFEYGEGEYFHNCESIWPEITQGKPAHWRNNMTATYYCTHSIGPMIHITGMRPVKVTGFEMPHNARCARMGYKGGLGSVIIMELENGSIVKSVQGVGISRNSVWYTAYGSKGRLESAREDAEHGDNYRIYVNLDETEGENANHIYSYLPHDELTTQSARTGHGGSDFYCMWNFVERIKGNPKADIIDVYEAMDMGLPGIFAYQSVCNGNVPVAFPDFRQREQREQFRNNTACTNPEKAGDMYIPTYSKGNPEVPEEVYARIKALWEERK